MRDGFKVIDADRHVLEPSDLFANYLPAQFRDRVRIEGPNQSRRSIDGEPISDADKMRPGAKSRKTMGSPLVPQRAGARPLRTRWRQNSTPRQTCATWTAKASM